MSLDPTQSARTTQGLIDLDALIRLYSDNAATGGSTAATTSQTQSAGGSQAAEDPQRTGHGLIPVLASALGQRRFTIKSVDRTLYDDAEESTGESNYRSTLTICLQPDNAPDTETNASLYAPPTSFADSSRPSKLDPSAGSMPHSIMHQWIDFWGPWEFIRHLRSDNDGRAQRQLTLRLRTLMLSRTLGERQTEPGELCVLYKDDQGRTVEGSWDGPDGTEMSIHFSCMLGTKDSCRIKNAQEGDHPRPDTDMLQTLAKEGGTSRLSGENHWELHPRGLFSYEGE